MRSVSLVLVATLCVTLMMFAAKIRALSLLVLLALFLAFTVFVLMPLAGWLKLRREHKRDAYLLLAALPDLLESVGRAVEHPDVSEYFKREFNDTKLECERFAPCARKSPAKWSTVCKLVTQTANLKRIIQSAEIEKRNAERARRKKGR